MAGPGRPRKNPPTDEFFEEPTTSEIQYAEFLDSLGPDNITCTIHRFPKVGKDMEWCDDIQISDAGLESIREHYGPGKYRLTFREGSLYRGSKTIKIAASYDRNAGQAPAPAANGDDKFYKEMILAMIASQKGPDMGQLLTGLGTMLAAMKPSSNGESPSAMLTAVIGAFQALKGKDVSDVDRLRETMSIINEFKGDEKAGADGDNLYSVAKDLGKQVIDLFSGPRHPAVARPPVARPAIPPGAVPVSALPAGNPEPAAESRAGDSAAVLDDPAQRTLQDWIRVQLDFLKAKAKAGKDAEFWVAYIFENEEEPGCAAILQAIERGATIEHLILFDPEIGADPVILRPWFEKFYSEVKNGLSEDDNESLDSAGAGRHIPDATGDEAGGPGGQSQVTDSDAGGKSRKSRTR